VKTADVVKMVEKYFGSIPRGPEVMKVSVPSVSLDQDRYVSYTDNYARLPLVTMVFFQYTRRHSANGMLRDLNHVCNMPSVLVLLTMRSTPNYRLTHLYTIAYAPLAALGAMPVLGSKLSPRADNSHSQITITA